MRSSRRQVRDGFFIFLLYSFVLGLFFYGISLSFDQPEALNVYTFVDTINPKSFDEFERQFGVRVNVKYFDSPGELLTEMRARQGRGYDVLFPTDFIVESLIEQDLLQPLDYSKIETNEQLDKRLFGRYFDPENKYTLPFAWSLFGIGYSKAFFPENFDKNASWKAFFEPHNFMSSPYSVGMTDSHLEVIFVACLYLFNETDTIDKRFNDILALLCAQKAHVQNYTGGNYHYLLASGLAKVLMVESAIMRKIMKVDDRFNFVIPKQGGLIGIENVGISKATKKRDLAHTFINFILSKEQGMLTWENGFNPSNKESYLAIDPEYYSNESFFPTGERFERMFITHNNFSNKKYERMWLRLKLF